MGFLLSPGGPVRPEMDYGNRLINHAQILDTVVKHEAEGQGRICGGYIQITLLVQIYRRTPLNLETITPQMKSAATEQSAPYLTALKEI